MSPRHQVEVYSYKTSAWLPPSASLAVTECQTDWVSLQAHAPAYQVGVPL